MQGKDVSEQETRGQSYVGIDVCKSWLDVHILPAEQAFRVPNTSPGHRTLKRRLERYDVGLIAIEATGKWHRPIHRSLNASGVRVRIVNPLRARLFAEAMGLLAKTDQLDAMTIAKVLLSGEARAGYVPSEQVTTYRELVRLHMQLSDEAAAYQNEIQALVVVLFPEFTQVFADPCLPTALGVLKAF